jgi:hypothetical protein
MFRILLAPFVTLALLSLVSMPSEAGDKNKTHEGKFVKVTEGKLTMTMKDGTKQHTHEIAKNAKITLDSKQAKIDDLKEGMLITVTTNPQNVATVIEAHTRKDKLR